MNIRDDSKDLAKRKTAMVVLRCSKSFIEYNEMVIIINDDEHTAMPLLTNNIGEDHPGSSRTNVHPRALPNRLTEVS